jgi:hypothetical protein
MDTKWTNLAYKNKILWSLANDSLDDKFFLFFFYSREYLAFF